MSDSHLLTTTLELLRARREPFRKICAEAKVEYHWLQKLSQGGIDDPGVKKIERLHKYLSRPEEPDRAIQE